MRSWEGVPPFWEGHPDFSGKKSGILHIFPNERAEKDPKKCTNRSPLNTAKKNSLNAGFIESRVDQLYKNQGYPYVWLF
jgi:hypothetical protein